MEKVIIEQNCIAPSEAREKLMAGNTIQIIDVRSPEEFAEKHIPQAINIPLDEMENFLSKLDKNLFFVTACGKGGGRSSSGAEKLREGGFRAAWLCGGTFGWFD